MQAGGQRFDPAQLHQFTLVSMRADNISFEEIKVCITSMKCCLFCKNREEKIDLEASRSGFYRKVSLGLKLILMMSLMA